MYYSKNHSASINVPRNYSGNTFRVIDESDRTYKEDKSAISKEEQKTVYEEPTQDFFEERSSEKRQSNTKDFSEAERADKRPTAFPSKTNSIPFLSHLISSISIEDFLLLGLIIVIHQENPDDSTLLLLLILLLTK